MVLYISSDTGGTREERWGRVGVALENMRKEVLLGIAFSQQGKSTVKALCSVRALQTGTLQNCGMGFHECPLQGMQQGKE